MGYGNTNQGSEAGNEVMHAIPENAIELADGFCESTGSYVYFLMLDGDCVYVGQTINLRHRLNGHRTKKYDQVFFIEVPEDVRIQCEKEWIAKLKPALNGPHGGARPGSGRKSKGDETKVTTSIRLTPIVLRFYRENGIPMADTFEDYTRSTDGFMSWLSQNG